MLLAVLCSIHFTCSATRLAFLSYRGSFYWFCNSYRICCDSLCYFYRVCYGLRNWFLIGLVAASKHHGTKSYDKKRISS